MIKNDLFFKILFAIELALLPLVVFAYLFLPLWAMGLIIAGVLLAKIWMELYKDRLSFTHTLISSIASVVVFTTLLILFINAGFVNQTLAIADIILIFFMNLFLVLLKNKNMPEFIEAVDYCYMLFEILTLISFIFLAYNNTVIVLIGLFTLLLTTVLSVGYKLYYFCRYTKFNSLFWRN